MGDLKGHRSRDTRTRGTIVVDRAKHLAASLGWGIWHELDSMAQFHFREMAEFQLRCEAGLLTRAQAEEILLECLPTAADEAITDHAILCRTNLSSYIRGTVLHELVDRGRVGRAKNQTTFESRYWRIF